MSKSKLTVFLVIILAISIALNTVLYFQNLNQTTIANQKLTSFNREFGNFLISSRAYDFSPPITKINALTIGLESDRWNVSSLENMTVSIRLELVEFTNTSNTFGFQVIREVKESSQSYSAVQLNNTVTDRYIWAIGVVPTEKIGLHPCAYYLVDAQTGELIPHGALF